MRLIFRGAAAILLVGGLPVGVLATQEQDLDALRRQVEAQQNKLAEQAGALRHQQEELERQMRELAALAETLKALSGEEALVASGTERSEAGGFVKSVAIADSDIEGAGPIFLPAAIGSAVPDEDG